VFDIPVADMVFLVCAIVAGALLLVTVLVDDLLAGVFDFLDLDVGGSSLMPLLLSFVAMFGVGGLFGTQVLDLSGAGAAVVGTISGAIGAGIAYVLFRFLRSSVSDEPFSQQDLVGTDAYVTVAIPATQWGSVSLRAEGQTHVFRATASIDIPRGETVHIVGVAGTGLIVELQAAKEDKDTEEAPPPGETAPDQPSE
jgi:membrane protein implicated in regulation of membrane protease activity